MTGTQGNATELEEEEEEEEGCPWCGVSVHHKNLKS